MISFKIWNTYWGTGSHNYVPFQAEWTIKETYGKILNLNRMPLGSHTIYTYGTFGEWRIPLKFIPYTYAQNLNDIFRENYRMMRLEVIEDGTSQIYSVMMLNKTSPLTQVVKPDATYWQGELLLSEY